MKSIYKAIVRRSLRSFISTPIKNLSLISSPSSSSSRTNLFFWFSLFLENKYSAADSTINIMDKNCFLVGLITFLATFCHFSLASDPNPLQNFCVADTNSSVTVNGFPCKNPKLVEVDDFFYSGMHIPGNTTNVFDSVVTRVSVLEFPGLNTLGISMARIDYAPSGINPPHTHPRGTEILTVLEGTLRVGFVTTNPPRFFSKVLQKGDAFVFPVGMIHFQRNLGNGHAVALSMLSSQNPGIMNIPRALFGSEPSIPTNDLAKAFAMDDSVMEHIKPKLQEH